METQKLTQEQLQEKLKAGIITFTYIKADGTERKAVGTTNPEIIEKYVGAPKDSLKPTREGVPGQIIYYDVESTGFRNFKFASFVKIEEVLQK